MTPRQALRQAETYRQTYLGKNLHAEIGRDQALHHHRMMQCCSVKGSAEELPKALEALKKLLQVLAPAAAVQAPGMVPQGRPRGADPAFTEDAVIGAHVANRETPGRSGSPREKQCARG